MHTHTFDQFYITLWIALCKQMRCGRLGIQFEPQVWKSDLHSDGSSVDGWFVLGLDTRPGFQMSFYIPIELWLECSFAQTLERAPVYDGHNTADVLKRIATL